MCKFRVLTVLCGVVFSNFCSVTNGIVPLISVEKIDQFSTISCKSKHIHFSWQYSSLIVNQSAAAAGLTTDTSPLSLS